MKNQKMGLGPTEIPLNLLNLETDLDHCLSTKRDLDFPIYLLLYLLVEVCTLCLLVY